MSALSEKARHFEALHRQPNGFILPNPWDIGSAKLMANRGFQALATSSSACANMLGRADYKITLDEALDHCRLIAGATDLPVSADFENGFADRPEAVANNVLRASGTGLVGLSIEDASGDSRSPIYPFDLAVERVRLAVVAARRLGYPFIITARAEGMLHGEKDLGDVIRRLQAFEKAGAPVVYAPGLTHLDQVRQVTAAVQVPVNVMALKMLDAPSLFAAGVKRVSLGPWFARAAMSGLLDAMDEVLANGTFTFIDKAPTGATIAKLMGG